MDCSPEYWAHAYTSIHRTYDKAAPGSEDSRAHWDSKAASFAHKPTRSDYVHQLIELMNLAPGETLFDMGCGSGTLSVPVAEAGHDVIAVDFSSAMLRELAQNAEEHGVASRIQQFQRSWQESWEGLPQGDVALSSRSFVTSDLADGIAKLEGQATKRIILTCGAGDLPYKDARIFAAMGRPEESFMRPVELMTIANYLWTSGRLPRIDYIEYPGVWHRPTKEALVETIYAGHEPQNTEEAERLDAYLEKHIVLDETHERWTLDYPRQDRWAVISWAKPTPFEAE